MINPSIIDERVDAARARDNAVTAKLLGECARLIAVDQYQNATRTFSLDTLSGVLRPARYSESGSNAIGTFPPPPENGSYAYQLYSAICFAIDARAELKLLELIQSPDFYAALMRSAAEVQS